MPLRNAVTQTLEGALRAALLARAPRLSPGAVSEGAFVAAADSCAEADRVYRTAITTALPPAAARQILTATDVFRAGVRSVRAEAVAQSARVAVRETGASVADPLDVATERIPNLSHVAAVRLADVSDRARAQVAALRQRANAEIQPALTPVTREALLAAKRVRLAAFRGAVHAALVPFTSDIVRYSDTVESLAAVADGWY